MTEFVGVQTKCIIGVCDNLNDVHFIFSKFVTKCANRLRPHNLRCSMCFPESESEEYTSGI